MATVYVTEAVDANYEDLETAVETEGGANPIEVTGAWTGTDDVGNGATITVAAATTITVAAIARNTNGYSGRAGDAYQLTASGAGHVFTIGEGADLTISDMDIRSDSTTASDEIFRVGTSEVDVTCKRCHLGFSGNTAEQDILYHEGDSDTVIFTFESCMFYDVGRSIVDCYDASGNTITVNFNSCSSINIGANGGRAAGAWYGSANSGAASTVTINAFNNLINCTGNNRVFAFATGDTTTLNADYNITNFAGGDGLPGLYIYADTANVANGNTHSVTFVEGDPAAGQVGLIETGTSPYDQRLFDDADNIAIDAHSIETGPDSGLAIPSDILGTERGADEDHDVGAFEIAAAGGGWTGKICGVINPSKICGVAVANISKVNGV